MPLFATYRAKVEHGILFVRIVNQYFERQQFFFGGATSEVLTAVLRESRARKLVSLGKFFVYIQHRNKCLRLAGEKFVLACESNLSLVTGLAS